LPSFDDAVTELDSAAEIQALNAEYKAMEAQISNTMEDSAYDPPPEVNELSEATCYLECTSRYQRK